MMIEEPIYIKFIGFMAYNGHRYKNRLPKTDEDKKKEKEFIFVYT